MISKSNQNILAYSNVYYSIKYDIILKIFLLVLPIILGRKSFKDKRLEEVGRRIKKLRTEKGSKSYETFALDNDLPTIQYWRLEKGANMRLDSLFKILDIHEISVEDFFKEFDTTIIKTTANNKK